MKYNNSSISDENEIKHRSRGNPSTSLQDDYIWFWMSPYDDFLTIDDTSIHWRSICSNKKYYLAENSGHFAIFDKDDIFITNIPSEIDDEIIRMYNFTDKGNEVTIEFEEDNWIFFIRIVDNNKYWHFLFDNKWQILINASEWTDEEWNSYLLYPNWNIVKNFSESGIDRWINVHKIIIDVENLWNNIFKINDKTYFSNDWSKSFEDWNNFNLDNFLKTAKEIQLTDNEDFVEIKWKKFKKKLLKI